MSNCAKALSIVTLLSCALATSAQADSVISAGLSGSVSTSVGSASDSFGRSSAGSSRQNGHARAQGDYRVVELTAIAERPDMVRMKLQAMADRGEDSELDLYLPQRVVDEARLMAGQVVSARQRPYGVEFAQGSARQAFFLVLDDDWLHEIAPNAVVL